MKYNFTSNNYNLVLSADTEGGLYKENIVYFDKPSISKSIDSITMLEFGQISRTIKGYEIGTVNGVSATGLDDAYTKISTFIAELEMSNTVSLLAAKLFTGGYAGTAKDLENAIVAAVTGASGISIVPTSPAPTGTGIASFTATQSGTYTNYGGVVVNANSFAVISRSAAGVYSISQTTFVIPTGKIISWVAQSYASGDQVNHLGKDWASNAATVAGDVPATSTKWIERLIGYKPETIIDVANTTKSVTGKAVSDILSLPVYPVTPIESVTINDGSGIFDGTFVVTAGVKYTIVIDKSLATRFEDGYSVQVQEVTSGYQQTLYSMSSIIDKSTLIIEVTPVRSDTHLKYSGFSNKINFTLYKSSDIYPAINAKHYFRHENVGTKITQIDTNYTLKTRPYFLTGNTNGTPTGNDSSWGNSELFAIPVGVNRMKGQVGSFISNIPPIVFYDVNQVFISFKGITPDAFGNNIFDVDIPSNAKFRSFQYSNGGGYYIEYYDSTTENLTPFALIPKLIDADKNTENVLVHSKTIESLKIACLGDSLTEGDFGTPVTFAGNVRYNGYPFYLSKFLNCDTTNVGASATSPKSYMAYVKYTSINWTKLYDVVVIMLGTNGGLTDTLATDVVPYSTPTSYADTETGWYCRLIEDIIVKTNSKAQIMLCIPPVTNRTGYVSNVASCRIVVPKIAERYSLPIIDLYGTSGISKFTETYFQPSDKLHLSKEGYKRIGTVIGSNIIAKLGLSVS
jgi:lysophospholipase L1-like esterase